MYQICLSMASYFVPMVPACKRLINPPIYRANCSFPLLLILARQATRLRGTASGSAGDSLRLYQVSGIAVPRYLSAALIDCRAGKVGTLCLVKPPATGPRGTRSSLCLPFTRDRRLWNGTCFPWTAGVSRSSPFGAIPVKLKLFAVIRTEMVYMESGGRPEGAGPGCTGPIPAVPGTALETNLIRGTDALADASRL